VTHHRSAPAALFCDADMRADLRDIPARNRSVRLYAAAIKARVCRPLAQRKPPSNASAGPEGDAEADR